MSEVTEDLAVPAAPGVSEDKGYVRGRKHHFLTHVLPDDAGGSRQAALDFLKVESAQEGVEVVRTMSRTKLREAFHAFYNSTTKSDNKLWLRRRLSEAMGLDPSAYFPLPKRPAAAGAAAAAARAKPAAAPPSLKRRAEDAAAAAGQGPSASTSLRSHMISQQQQLQQMQRQQEQLQQAQQQEQLQQAQQQEQLQQAQQQEELEHHQQYYQSPPLGAPPAPYGAPAELSNAPLWQALGAQARGLGVVPASSAAAAESAATLLLQPALSQSEQAQRTAAVLQHLLAQQQAVMAALQRHGEILESMQQRQDIIGGMLGALPMLAHRSLAAASEPVDPATLSFPRRPRNAPGRGAPPREAQPPQEGGLHPEPQGLAGPRLPAPPLAGASSGGISEADLLLGLSGRFSQEQGRKLRSFLG